MRAYHILASLLFLIFTLPALGQADSPTVQYQSGKDLAKAGKLTEAITAFDSAIKLDPTFGEAYVDRGNTYGELKKIREAFADYIQSIVIEEKKPQTTDRDRVLWRAYTNRGTILLRTQAYDKAFADYNTAIKLEPKNASEVYNRSILYYIMGDYDMAVAELKRARELNPKVLDRNFSRPEAETNKKAWDLRKHPVIE